MYKGLKYIKMKWLPIITSKYAHKYTNPLI